MFLIIYHFLNVALVAMEVLVMIEFIDLTSIKDYDPRSGPFSTRVAPIFLLR